MKKPGSIQKRKLIILRLFKPYKQKNSLLFINFKLPIMLQNTHDIVGTTIFIGKTQISTVYGDMTAYTFQDLIHKGYVIALAHGDINEATLYTRMHSSCVTSQLMRSLDCDCVQQLNGAIKKICENNGILFYLIQQGRGCGYVGKSRACQTVQYYENQKDINTFEAYEMLGMKHDYRQYKNVKDIIRILNIKSQFILLTNNPDKIQKFTKLGINLKGVESIEISPNPFNQTYLMSKQQYGHILFQTKKKVQKYEMPYQRIAPFTPYGIPSCERFVHVSSYYLPIKPVNNRIILTQQQYNQNCSKNNNAFQIIRNPAANNQRAYYTEMTTQEIQAGPEHFTKPNWFQINVHYDIVTNQDYLVLKYGNPQINQVPVIRIHSESVFNRFPLVNRDYKQKYKTSLDLIIRNGYGFILIFYNDGRGSGLGYFILNSQNESGLMKSVDSEKKQFLNSIGVEEDKRDFYGAIKLLSHYVKDSTLIDLACGDTSLQYLPKYLQSSKLRVRKYIKIQCQSESKGIFSIDKRIRSLETSVQEVIKAIDHETLKKLSAKIVQSITKKRNIYSTGIGSSEAHSKYLSLLFSGKIKHIHPMNLQSIKDEDYFLIVYSQGLSPNIIYCLKSLSLQNIAFVTSVDVSKQNSIPEKQKFCERLNQKKSLVLRYPTEVPDDTLIRITGPYVVYFLNSLLLRLIEPSDQQNVQELIQKHYEGYKKLNYKSMNVSNKNNLIESLAKHKNLIICCDYPSIEAILNAKFKFIEGAMINAHVIDYVNFAHGTYQFIENYKGKYTVWYITQQGKQLHEKTIQMVDIPQKMTYTTTYTKEEIPYLPLKLELEANYIVFQLIQILGVNQLNWPGKEKQKILYSVYQ